MNYAFMMEGEFPDETVRDSYAQIAGELEEAERLYWNHPRECGIMLRNISEHICRFYNDYYSIGFPAEATLEGFLCYTGEDSQNVMVSRFLSSVRKEQRDRLNKLRVIGDDCLMGMDGPDRGMRYEDRMAQNAEKMLDAMMEVVKEMCRKINGRTDVEDYRVCKEKLAGYCEEKEESVRETRENKGSLLSKLFSKKNKKEN